MFIIEGMELGCDALTVISHLTRFWCDGVTRNCYIVLVCDFLFARKKHPDILLVLYPCICLIFLVNHIAPLPDCSQANYYCTSVCLYLKFAVHSHMDHFSWLFVLYSKPSSCKSLHYSCYMCRDYFHYGNGYVKYQGSCHMCICSVATICLLEISFAPVW
jgi:hypothetical protein